MFFTGPAETQYDLKFSLAGIPVRVSPSFWFVALLLGIGGDRSPQSMLIWVGAVFVSILIHELGHALAVRCFGWQPAIVLHSFGGLAIYRPTYHSPQKQIVISLCGPLAGFLFAALIVAGMSAAGVGGRIFGVPIGGAPLANPHVARLLGVLLVINIFWGVVNLLPVIPLDGGQIMQNVLSLTSLGRKPFLPYQVSMLVAVATAIAAFILLESIFMAVLFGLLAFQNYQMVQAYRGGPPGGMFRY